MFFADFEQGYVFDLIRYLACFFHAQPTRLLRLPLDQGERSFIVFWLYAVRRPSTGFADFPSGVSEWST